MSNYFSSLTDVGRKRKLNEDAVRAEAVNDPQTPIETVLIVADGMGGHNSGEIASQEAEKTILQLFVYGEYKKFAQKVGINSADLKQILYEAIFYIDKKIKNIAQSSHSEKGMGTTLTVALILKTQGDDRDVIIGHVGDSRAYFISPTGIKLITADDSLVWKYYTRGMISYEEMRTHPEKNVITQALGGDTLEKPQVFMERLKDNSVLLLCSDGLHGMLNDKHIFQICRSSNNGDAVTKLLIDYANKAGGKDNISAAVYSRSYRTAAVKKKISKVPFLVAAVISFILILSVAGYFVIPKIWGTTEDSTKVGPQVGGETSNPQKDDWKKLTIEANPNKTTIEIGQTVTYTLNIPENGEYEYNLDFDGKNMGIKKYPEDKKFDRKYVKVGENQKIKIIVYNLANSEKEERNLSLNVVAKDQPNDNLPKIKFVLKSGSIVKLEVGSNMDKIKKISWGDGKNDTKDFHKYSSVDKAENAKITVYFKTGQQKTYRVEK